MATKITYLFIYYYVYSLWYCFDNFPTPTILKIIFFPLKVYISLPFSLMSFSINSMGSFFATTTNLLSPALSLLLMTHDDEIELSLGLHLLLHSLSTNFSPSSPSFFIYQFSKEWGRRKWRVLRRRTKKKKTKSSQTLNVSLGVALKKEVIVHNKEITSIVNWKGYRRKRKENINPMGKIWVFKTLFINFLN